MQNTMMHAARPGMIVRLRDLVHSRHLNGLFGAVETVQPSGRVVVRVQEQYPGHYSVQPHNLVVPDVVCGWCHTCRSGRVLRYTIVGALQCSRCGGEFVEGTPDRESFDEARTFVPTDGAQASPPPQATFLSMQGPWFRFEAVAPMGGQGFEEMMHRMFMQAQDESNAPPPASDEAIASLETFAAGDSDLANGDTCAVCQDDYAAGDRLARMPCGHIYHADCVTPWLQRNHTCPTCRAPLEETLPRTESKEAHEDPPAPDTPAVAEM